MLCTLAEFGRILNVNEILKKKVSVQEDTEFLVDGVLDGDPTAQHGTDASPSNADPASASALPPQPLNTQVSGICGIIHSGRGIVMVSTLAT